MNPELFAWIFCGELGVLFLGTAFEVPTTRKRLITFLKWSMIIALVGIGLGLMVWFWIALAETVGFVGVMLLLIWLRLVGR